MKLTVLILGILFQWAATASAQESFIYDDHGKRDPLLSLVSSTGAFLNYDSDFQIVDLVLEGIMEDASGNLAIVNGKIVKEGDQIGSFIVGKITQKNVILTKDNQNFVLQLKKGD